MQLEATLRLVPPSRRVGLRSSRNSSQAKSGNRCRGEGRVANQALQNPVGAHGTRQLERKVSQTSEADTEPDHRTKPTQDWASGRKLGVRAAQRPPRREIPRPPAKAPYPLPSHSVVHPHRPATIEKQQFKNCGDAPPGPQRPRRSDLDIRGARPTPSRCAQGHWPGLKVYCISRLIPSLIYKAGTME